MARQPGSRTQGAFAFESVYGTPPASGYRRMLFATTRLVSEQGLLVADDARSNSPGLPAAKRGRRRRDGILTGARTVLVFLLLRHVKMPKKLDLDALAMEATARLPGVILWAWR